MALCIIMLKLEVMAADEWHDNESISGSCHGISVHSNFHQ
jgi:hypothetical protein